MIKKFKNFFKKYRSNHGTTLIEVMVAAGVLSGVALATMEVMKQLNLNQMSAMRRSDATDYVQQIKLILNNSTACSNSFSGVNTASLPSAEQTIRDSANGTVFNSSSSASVFGNRMKIESLKVTAYDATTRIATIKIQFMFYNGDVIANPALVPIGRTAGTVYISVKLSGTTINGCYSEKDETINQTRAFSCSDAGGIWNNSSKDCTEYNELRSKSCSDGGGTWSGSDCSNYAEIRTDIRQKTCSDAGGTWYASSLTCSDLNNITKEARLRACSDAGGTWTATANANYGDCTNYAEAATDGRAAFCSDAGGQWISSSATCTNYIKLRGEACGDAGGAWVSSNQHCEYIKIQMLHCQTMNPPKVWNNADRKCY